MVIQPNSPDHSPFDLGRVAGGVTYQPIYTFHERTPSLADLIRSDLFRSSASPLFVARHFRVAIENDMIRITHVDHPGWEMSVGQSDIFFRHDRPKPNVIDDVLTVQAAIEDQILTRLSVEGINSIGVKFIVSHPIDRGGTLIPASVVDLSLEGSLVSSLSDISEMAFRISYIVPSGSATLQLSIDPNERDIIADLDYYNVDPYSLSIDSAAFRQDAYRHLQIDVARFLSPLGTVPRAASSGAVS